MTTSLMDLGNKENEQLASELKKKIALFADFDGDTLHSEMADLKKAILENPAACSLLLPEDIGALVTALRRITGVAIAAANAPKEKKTPAKKSTLKLTSEELQAQLALIDDSEL